MASESSDEWASVALPPDLEEWLDRKAADLGLDRRTVVVQLLASYRATEELGDGEVEGVVVTEEDVERRVRDVIAERIPDIASGVEEQLGARALGDGEDVAAVEERLAAEIDRVESEFAEKIEDVRERVVQVKRETDAKAPAEHTHEEIADLASAVEALETTVEGIESDVGANSDRVAGLEDDLGAATDRLAAVEDAADRLDDVEDRLTRVAWVVSDLRDEQRSRAAGTEAVDRLKRAAAELDVDRAVCGDCSEGVEIALLSEPKCPHCGTAVSDVEPGGRIFGKPTLRVASQLEAADADERGNVPDAADREGDR